MNEKSESPLPAVAPASSGGQPKTIAIRPVHLAVAVLSVVAFGGGIWLARASAPPPPAAAAALVTNPLVITTDQSQNPFVVQAAPQQIDPDMVVPLEPPVHPLIGQQRIDIEGVSLDGQPAKLSDYSGKPVMLNFWATWCPPCRVEMPWMEQVYQEFKDQGFVILAVDAGERVAPDYVQATVSGFIQSTGLTFPILLPNDPYTPQTQYSVYGLPSTYMINPEGVVVDVHRGMYPNRGTLRDRVVKLLGAGGA